MLPWNLCLFINFYESRYSTLLVTSQTLQCQIVLQGNSLRGHCSSGIVDDLGTRYKIFFGGAKVVGLVSHLFHDLVPLRHMLCEVREHTSCIVPVYEIIYYRICMIVYGQSYAHWNLGGVLGRPPPLYAIWHPYPCSNKVFSCILPTIIV